MACYRANFTFTLPSQRPNRFKKIDFEMVGSWGGGGGGFVVEKNQEG